MRIKLLFIFSILVSISVFSQNEKKPTLMILPSDHWCNQRLYTTSFDNQGSKITVPDYQTAFLQDEEIKGVFAKIGEMLTILGYSIKDCEQELKNINVKRAEDNVTKSKSGSTLNESSLDILKRRTKADIILQVDWEINKNSNGKYLTFTLEAFDSYTSKRIATTSGTGNSTNDIIPILLENAVKSHIKILDSQMSAYFNEQRTNGREILLTIKKWESWENDLETEYDGEELTDCIQNWLRDNTVNSVFNLSDGTENFAQFEQIRIPLFDENGNSLDARGFATKLRKHLQKPPFNITSKVLFRGLGEAVIILGEK